MRHKFDARLLPARFKNKILMIGDCWAWAAFVRPDGYAIINWNGKRSHYAHRAVYELLVGPIPESLTLDHRCRNRMCVNPAHLEPISFTENVLRGTSFAAENAQKTHCPKGHDYARHGFVNTNGSRECRICATNRKLEWQRWNRKALRIARSLGLGTRQVTVGV